MLTGGIKSRFLVSLQSLSSVMDICKKKVLFIILCLLRSGVEYVKLQV